MIDFEKMTLKMREAVKLSIDIGVQNGNQQIEPVHILKACLTQEGSIASAIVEKAGASPSEMLIDIDKKYLPFLK